MSGVESVWEGTVREGFAVLLGAGVSRHSGVPLTSDFQHRVLESAGAPLTVESLIREARLPFESFVQTIIETLGSLSVLQAFDGGAPNRTHSFVAELAAAGACRAVVTTNFDRLLEGALEGRCPYHRYFRETELQRVELNNGKLPIVKLHGDIGDLSSLAATIRAVGNRTQALQRRAALHAMCGCSDIRTIVVVGYSCSDVFDIQPAFATAPVRSARIVLVEHVDVPWRDAQVVSLRGTRYQPFFRGFDGYVLRCNTDDWVEFGWRHLKGEPAPALDSSTYDWQSCVDSSVAKAAQDIGGGVGHLLIGKLLQAAGEYGLSNRYLRWSRRGLTADASVAQVWQSMGDNHRDLDAAAKVRPHENLLPRRRRVALGYLRKARLAARSTDRGAHARALMSLGVVYADHAESSGSATQLERAMRYYRKATSEARRSGDLRLAGIGFGNMGIALKNAKEYLSAATMQRRAIRVALDVGDLRSVSRAWGNLGITQSELGDSRRAIGYYRRALALSVQLGDSRHVGIWLYNIGYDREKLGESSRAVACYSKARRLFSRLGISSYVHKCDERLGALASAT